KTLSFPFLISSMTGGPEKAATINKNLAIAAQETKVALALGSMRVIIRHPESKTSFDIRRDCPDIPLFANLGMIQLNYGFGLDEIKEIVDTIEADGIFLHVNHLQEAIQPEGDTDYKYLLEKLAKIIDDIPVPVLIKEVGAGIDYETAKSLSDIGVKWIDVSGLGGTSWSWVEGYRRDDDLGDVFKAVGIPTDECIQQCKDIPELNLIAGGGIRTGLDIAKSIALGAKIATAAKPLLAPALESPEASINALEKLKKQLEIAMFSAGIGNINGLEQAELVQK
ncbi:MAG TPA: type 2 isopentenyl-diphosphate Delta-isomerase, partial [Candidatus Dojkabacteria bacterium]